MARKAQASNLTLSPIKARHPMMRYAGCCVACNGRHFLSPPAQTGIDSGQELNNTVFGESVRLIAMIDFFEIHDEGDSHGWLV
jgi:hypothetical protein